MKKKIVKNSIIVMGISFVIGIILVFKSPSIGQNMGDNAIQENDGSMDTNQYEMIIKSNTESFRTGGLVISLIGGLGLLLSGYAFYNEIDEDSLNNNSTSNYDK
ncbi:hypothetical protein K0040_18295 [Terrisporobacter petrolearius]|uniref:hypothetical protein n=1 Tax=Terrisporobacter petrolearius TaxID=1460447 RepID=UPI001D16D009|nr:hypothetical protein [Terrisporobacter petrolearius]MCC3866207.1 hypothetical protein [Terrisporobacter petrolearius]